MQPFENGKIVNWQQEVQNIRLAAGGEAQNGAIFRPGPKLPQKVSHKEKIRNFANFDLKFWQWNSHATKVNLKKNLKKIQVLEPPQIDLRTEPKLVGTNGRLQKFINEDL